MDCFLADGLEVIFRLALALLLLGKPELLLQDMEGVIRVSQTISLALKPQIDASFSPRTVLPKRDAQQVRLRPRARVQHGVRPQAEPQEDEEAGEGVHHHEDQGEGGRN